MKIKLLREHAQTPSYGSPEAAGADLYACLDTYDILIKPHTTVMVPTGLAMEIPLGYFGGIYARSGLASKRALRPANCVGVVDSDYRGEVMVALHNDSDVPQVINDGERIAQLVLHRIIQVDFSIVDELDETERGEGGFGSTGTK